jgi:AmiR/NasT family two-component response regulator
VLLRANPAAYDMLISDLNMSEMGYSSESNAIEAVNIGVSGYLVEPFQPSDALAAVARALTIPAA